LGTELAVYVSAFVDWVFSSLVFSWVAVWIDVAVVNNDLAFSVFVAAVLVSCVFVVAVLV